MHQMHPPAGPVFSSPAVLFFGNMSRSGNIRAGYA